MVDAGVTIGDKAGLTTVRRGAWATLLASALVASLAMAGCTGDAMISLDPTAAPTVAASLPAGTTASTAEKTFDPFTSTSSTDRPLREVIQNPSLDEVMRPGPLPEFSIGRPDAPVTIIKYASLTCPFCKRFQAEVFPVLKRDYIDTGKVRFMIREFPIGKTSGMATIALRCAPMARYLDLYGRYLAQQAQWVSQEVRIEPILKVAQGVGLSAEQFDSCRQNQGMIAALNQVKDRGRELGVIGTPNFFINGRLIKKALGLKELREIIDPLIERPSLAVTPVSVPR
jgi:protein-disulfide isomerase